VVSTVIHGSIGSDPKIACISAELPAVHRPSARERPGSLHSRSRCPAAASSRVRGLAGADVVDGLVRRPVRDVGGHRDEVLHGRLLLVLWK
jgi:hypothetical protein